MHAASVSQESVIAQSVRLTAHRQWSSERSCQSGISAWQLRQRQSLRELWQGQRCQRAHLAYMTRTLFS